MSPSPLWYLSRGSGIVSLLLLSASTALGILTTVRWSSPAWPRFLSQAVHRDVSLLVVGFLCLHIVTAIIDPFAHLSPIDAVIPFAAAYRPLWLGLGVIAAELLLAVVVTSLFRRRLGARTWRLVHWAAYAAWPVAVLHGLGTGTDAASRWSLALTAASAGAVGIALTWRLGQGWRPQARIRAGFAAVAVCTVVGTALFAIAGPLQPGWARRAGTPPALLTGAAPTDGTASGAPVLDSGLDLRLTGTLQDDGTTTTLALTSASITVSVQTPDQGGGGGLLEIDRAGSRVCATEAAGGDPITATCSGLAIQLTVRAGADDSVRAHLTTGAG